MVSSQWFEQWIVFVKKQLEEVNVYIGSMLPRMNEDIVSAEVPAVLYEPPFDNKNIFLKDNLKEVKDFRIINRALWDVLKRYNCIPIRRSLRRNQQGKLFTEAYFDRVQCVSISRSLMKRVTGGQQQFLPFGPMQLSKY